MFDLGHFSLVVAWLLSVYAVIVGGIGAFKRKGSFVQSAANAFLFMATLVLLSLFSLGVLFLKHDYRYAYVWQNSNNEMHWIYLLSAVWGGMDGSMLLWAAMLSLFGALGFLRTQDVSERVRTWYVPVVAASTSFFLLVIVFLTNPFRLVPTSVVQLDGRGLNPLLQNPSMMIHPPMLYAGFCGFVVPFAFCLAALLAGDYSNQWMRATRRWSLIAWGFLTLGIILGGHWAYIELGWGGFWAWDPVENASFLPWLTATAFIHSVMVQQRRGLLKVWNVALCVLTYTLTVFGTFLTRSGIVQSVHAFAETDVGWVFLVYIGMLILGGSALIVFRFRHLRPENGIESYLSREAVFVFNNLLLLSICFAVMWGVLFPVISEAVTGSKSVVGPPFFNRVTMPLFLLLLLFMGIGPLIAWRRTNLKHLKKTFLSPLIFGSIVTVIFLFLDPSRLLTAVSFGVAFFVILTVLSEFYRAAKARQSLVKENRAAGVMRLVFSKPQRYGGLIVHLGVAVMAIAITASMSYKIEEDFTLRAGEPHELGPYQLELLELSEADRGNYAMLQARVRVRNAEGEQIAVLSPERRFYKSTNQDTTEVAIHSTFRDDLYLAFAGLEETLGETRAVFKGFVNPLQWWLWFGSAIVLLGTIAVIGFPIREQVTHYEQVTERAVGVAS